MTEYYFKEVRGERHQFECAKFGDDAEADGKEADVVYKLTHKWCDCPGWYRSKAKRCKHQDLLDRWLKNQDTMFLDDEQIPNPFVVITENAVKWWRAR